MGERDRERVALVTRALAAEGLDALLCTLPSNVLLVSGYWPVVGNAIAVVTREGQVAVAAPEDEKVFAEAGWADDLRTFSSGSLDQLVETADTASHTLRDLASALEIEPGSTIGVEGSAWLDPSGYAAKFVYGAGVHRLLAAAFQSAGSVDASACLARLRSALTGGELASLRRACAIARDAFIATSWAIEPGTSETEVAALLRAQLDASGNPTDRCDGYAYCMSGANAANAWAAYQHSGPRVIARGDFVLLHCNSYANGFCTDITRTYSIGPPGVEESAIIKAVMSARRAALAAVRPGVAACEVDRAARAEMESRGFGKAFKHPTGHGVGFAAIDHNARPRIHPKSAETLEPGMVFNIEPAAYLPPLGGMRHCDMVLVTGDGAELLTDFQTEVADLVL